mmetsp:Transcript_7134/g.26239  ORF Transcript_7134/g.26239 Transcript_7134/m.26239 type:complete len:597 (+) Transcript_7134:164-1954(+)
MPTVGVGRDKLFAAIGKTFTEEEFDELCFEFGIELDEVTTEAAMQGKMAGLKEEEMSTEAEEVIYKIDVPANRYDLLCIEGLARGLRIFLGLEATPEFRLASVEQPLRMTVKPETALIRPFVVCAVLRGCTFDKTRYDSFIDLQDKLHHNICRRRTLVAIGTHDLSKLTPPFTYEALPPQDIKFIPLKQTEEMSADYLVNDFYKQDQKLKKFLHIISDSVVYPVLYDANRTVLSLPPIINGSHSAISLETKDVFIECTATDLTKAKIVLDTMVTMFAQYCVEPFVVEPVEVISADGSSAMYPDLTPRSLTCDRGYIARGIGVPELGVEEVCNLLTKMQLPANSEERDGKQMVTVKIPPTRSDVLHACDVMEDVAIAYGYNNIKVEVPKVVTEGKQQRLNHFTELLRQEMAMAGYTEMLTFSLCSYAENFSMVNVEDDGNTAVIVGNPRGADFEVLRSSLLPGALKTMGANKDAPVPMKLFEISDVALLDAARDVGARNERRLVGLYCALQGTFEVIHGLLDRVMQVCGVRWGEENGYKIVESHRACFLAGRQVDVVCRGEFVGTFGIVHPSVLKNFDIVHPCAALEMNIEWALADP